MSVSLSKASRADLNELLALLAVVNLPTEGVVDHIDRFRVARDIDNRLVGCAGLEMYGRLGLLRSVAVSPDSQHAGLGSKLTSAILDEAAEAGVEEVALLTTTARDFFARRFGFIEAIAQTITSGWQHREWLLPRCSSAAFMLLRLK